MDIKMILFDVDSTLTSAMGMPVVESAIDAIRQLQEKGIIVVVASGRPPHGIPAIEGKIFPDYYIGANGHIISDRDKNPIYIQRFDQDIYRQVSDYCQSHGLGLFWKYEDIVCVKRESPHLDRIKPAIGEHVSGNHPKGKMPCGGGLLLDDNPEVNQAFVERFKDKIGIVDGGYNLYDLCVKGVDKATAAQKLCDYLNLTAENCMAFGDSDNDIEMIQFAKVGIAMGNGFQSAKDAADYVTDDAGNDGILKALKKFEIL